MLPLTSARLPAATVARHAGLYASTPLDADAAAALVRRARSLVSDLRTRSAAIYWTDLMLSAALTWGAIAWGGRSGTRLLVSVLALGIAGVSLTRATMFLHEIVHLRPGSLPGFHIAWNALVGIPFGVPSYLYARVHLDHHRLSVYRTLQDPEHAPDDRSAWDRMTVQSLFFAGVPVVFAVRWLVIAPLAWSHRDLRSWVDARASALCANPAYTPKPFQGRARTEARVAEALCFAWCAMLAAGTLVGRVSLRAVAIGAGAASIASVLSNLRGEILHRFASNLPAGTLARQVFDSITVPHTGVLSAVTLPVGIGYHALHHLDTQLPYHAMGAAHRRLMATLPSDSLYHRTRSPNLVAAVREAVDRARTLAAHRRRVHSAPPRSAYPDDRRAPQ